VSALLRDLPMPVRLLLGNHDNRATFRAEFPGQSVDPHGFVQSTERLGNDLLVFLDTQDEGARGRLCERRLAWLDAALAADDSPRVLLFMHHPPTVGEVPHLRDMQLLDTDPLAALLRRDERIAGLFCGHLHLPLVANWQGLTVAVNGGLSFRIVLNLRTRDAEFAGSPLTYGVVLLSDIIIAHTEIVLANAP
jgi:3',5'-cyclic AMP phosphodiesterase CpdA